MRKLLTLLIIIILFLGCATTLPAWQPYIGCRETELIENWGRGGDSSYYPKYDIKKTWYHKDIWTGFVFGGYDSSKSKVNYLFTIKKGKVVDYSIH